MSKDADDPGGASSPLADLGPRVYESIFDNSYDGIYVVDRERRILMWNPSAERITGYPAAEVVGRHCFDNILQHEDEAGRALCTFGCPLERSIESGKPGAARVTLKRADGTRLAVDVSVSPIVGEGGSVVGALEVFRDVTSYEKLEAAAERIARLTYKDYLTGVSNRREVAALLEKEIRRARRHWLPLSVVMMDLDEFKRINDSFGHAVGDAALKRVAGVLRRVVRDTDAIGRWGGDEFLIVAPMTDVAGAHEIAERVRARVARGRVRGSTVAIKLSLGVTQLDGPDVAKTLLARADAALYEAKREGGDRVVVK